MKLIKIRHIGLVSLLILFVGCASLKVDSMVVEQTSFGFQHPATVALGVGAQSTGINPRSVTISPEAFREAVKKSLEKSALFKSIVNEDIADYVLKADLIFAGSHAGASMTSWVDVNWTLDERASGENVWSAEISKEGHVGAFEAFNGMTRQYMALERGAQANINTALTQIGQLTIIAP
ncbi:MAG: hypothetical protein WBH40_02900 [Ignavibacteriaceae bacterium]